MIFVLNLLRLFNESDKKSNKSGLLIAMVADKEINFIRSMLNVLINLHILFP